MSIREYPKHQFSIEIENDETISLLRFAPSFSGYLKHIRVKMLAKNYSSLNGRARLVVMSDDESVVIGQSEFINYKDITKPEDTNKYWHTFVRFDFPELALTKDVKYKLGIFQEDYELSKTSSMSYCLDYNYPVNQTSLVNNPFTNPRLSAEIYMLKDYYEFE